MLNAMLLSFLFISTTFAYLVTSSQHHGVGIVSSKTTFENQSIEGATEGALLPKKRHRYNLGLGKNSPVTAQNAPLVDHKMKKKIPSNYHQATKYLVEHESINTYPNPSNQISSENKREIPQPTVTPIRLAEDVFDIAGTGADARAKFQVAPTELDMNTLWVEMLIHQQQNQLAYAHVLSGN